jgi:hypothetical protein
MRIDVSAMKPFLLALMLLMAPVIGWTEEQTGPVVFKAGNWDVRKETDRMTDKVSCVATPRGQHGALLFDQGFFIPIEGGIKHYRMRFDDDPVRSQLPSSIEQRTSAVAIYDYASLFRAQRVRVEAVTRLGHVVFRDININGFEQVYEFLQGPACQPT